MSSAPLVSPHDPVGTNLFGHVLRGRLMRVVPRENEAINETWIADRDRFSYEGVYSADRLMRPMRAPRHGVGRDRLGDARSCRWPKGCRPARGGPGRTRQQLRHARGAVPRAAAWRADWASNNIDHRLRQRDFRDQAADPVFPGLGMHDRRGRRARCAAASSARTCGARRRCWRTACARPPGAARR